MFKSRSTVLAAVATASVVLALVQVPSAALAAGPNLAAGKTFTASTVNGGFPTANAGDGNATSYWESTNNVFPQWLQVDLGAAMSVNQTIIKLPPATNWQTRTQTLSVQGSTNGTAFSTIVNSAGYTFNPATGNTVTIDFAATTARFLRVNITANTGWPAGQVGELEVYGPVSTDPDAPTAPGNLSFTQPGSGQIRLAWNASTDNVGVTGYDVYADNNLLTSVAGNVLSYTDSRADSVTVSYFVRARDAAGNTSPASNTVTRTGTGVPGTNLAVGKPIEASSTVFTFIATNANDNNTGTYWEGNGYPAALTVKLGANASTQSIVVKLNPDPVWGPRTQTFSILGREQSATTFTTLVPSAAYNFNPSSGNSVTIPVSANVADIQLNFTANTGAPSGQVAELQVIGTPAPNPDLTITAMSFTPAAPVETDAVTLSATVRNAGNAGSPATTVNFYLGTTRVGTANVGALAAGASTSVSANIGPRDAGSYPLSARVDEGNTVVEQNDNNNTFTNPTNLVVSPVASSDLVASVGWSPGNPSAGSTVTFSVTLRNQGSTATAGGAHGVTLTLLSGATTVRTLTGSFTGALAPGASSTPINMGTWPAVNGRYTVRVVVAADANELPVKQANNTSEQPFFVGRGANLPYDMYEAEDGQLGGGATTVGPNRTIGNLGGEASGRRAVTLNATGAFVQWNTRASTNTVVARFSIPDNTNSSINVYVNGALNTTLPLTSRYAWLYGAEASPSNSGTDPRHIYDEANIILNGTVPAGSTLKLQKDGANSGPITIDFINTEQVAPAANPDPARYVVPTGTDQQAVQNALDAARQDTTKAGVYLPAGTYATSNKFNISGRPIDVVGAGIWFTRFQTPQGQENTDAGFGVQSTASGSSFRRLAFFGNYTSRIDGPGKVWGELRDVNNLTIDDVWVEHTVCMYWGVHVSGTKITNARMRNTFADGVNLTNGSTNNLVSNSEARATGDDGFALFSATDAGVAVGNNGNVFENLNATLTWRAAGLAVYGGFNNIFRNIYIADMLTYSGITISSLDFGIPMVGFSSPPTVFDNISIVRGGGHFWGAQTFPAIWVFSASKEFRAIRVSNVDIVDPTYTGIMFQTNYVGGQPQNPVTDTVFTNVSISGAQKSGDAFDAKSGYGIWANPLPEPGQGPAVGSATFTNLTLSNNAVDINNPTNTFTITRN